MNKKEETASDYRLLSGVFFRLLPYQVLLIVINAVNGIVDSIYASNAIGTGALSAIGLYSPMNHFLYAVSMMLVSGSQVLCGKYLARDRGHIQSIFTVDLAISLGVSLLTSLGMVLWAVTGAAGTSGPDSLKDYILGQAVGVPALVLGQQFFAFLSLENRTRRTMAASLTCFAVNAVFDHVLVVFFSMGTFGLGLSSSLSAWMFLAVQAAWYLKGRSEWKLSPGALKTCRWGDALKICSLGYSGALSRFVEAFRCLIVNALVLRFVGSVGLSAFAASNSFLAVIWAVPFGMLSTARMLMSIAVGNEDRRSLVDTVRVVFTKGMLVMCVIVALLILSAVPLTHLFYGESAGEVFGMTVAGFRILPLCMLPALISLTFAGYYQTIDQKPMKIVLPVVDGVVGVVLFSAILIPLMGINGLYIANVLNGVLCLLLIFLHARRANRRAPRTAEDLMAIPQGFGVPAQDRMDLTVRNLGEVVKVSESVMDFCAAHGIDRRRSYLAGLCLEEMAGNVITHGFTADKRGHSVDVRVAARDEGLILCLRDNCIAFDPSVHAMGSPDENIKNVGIHLVYSMAADVTYQNLLGMNVLTVRL